jgi:CRP/FNR family transcriptional regulator
MSRAEIGTYLGLTLETVCRMVSKLQELSPIRTQRREVEFVDVQGLTAIPGEAKEST